MRKGLLPIKDTYRKATYVRGDAPSIAWSPGTFVWTGAFVLLQAILRKQEKTPEGCPKLQGASLSNRKLLGSFSKAAYASALEIIAFTTDVDGDTVRYCVFC